MANEKKQKILIIDDDSFLLDMYALKFSESSFEVVPSQGSEDALAKLREGLIPDVMLVDIVMPKIDGFELLKIIQKEKLGGDTLKVILSNRGQQADIDMGNTLGAAGYIVKASATPSEVVKKIKDIVSVGKKK